MKTTEQYSSAVLFNMLYTKNEDDARPLIGQYLLIILPVKHMKNVVII